MDKKRAAIILAAGMGTRLRPLTETDHKCMTKVCGTPIILQALSTLRQCQFDEVIVVIGYLADRLMQQIEEFDLDIKITFAENVMYDQTSTVYSLWKGMERLGQYDELYVIEGDVFFEQAVLERLIHSAGETATVLEPYNERLEGTFVELDRDGYVADWRHKSEQPEGYFLCDKFKTVNLHKFSKRFIQDVLQNEISENKMPAVMNQPIEKIMRKIVGAHPNIIYGEVLHGEKWWEIDDTNDLHIAENIFQK